MLDQDRISVFLSYLGFVGIVPPYLAYFFFAKSPYARFHAKQGIFLTLTFLASMVLWGLVRLLALTQGWSERIVVAGYGGLFFLYIVLNLLAAIFGLLGRQWAIPGFSLWLKK
ncbi:MAG: hypothetical protein CL920_21865 [Deltaproteobacteria bacterium]|nr:hypothetical protein [Deltaproteobacteria bacterium]MBU51345.1 hypothetical protein [Deltaproteobacteria bacterium]|tara:strand:+ start:5745 stop:6083 length:339 start_codon:yes stop_codon:yes gene_type:complete